METENVMPHSGSLSTGSSVLGGTESLSRRRAISNIGRIVNGFRTSSAGRPRHSDSAYGFLLPHERRRVVRSDPLPPPMMDFSSPLPFFGSSPTEATGTRRHWRRGRRLPKPRGPRAERCNSVASAQSTSAPQTEHSCSPPPPPPSSSPPCLVGEPCATSDLTDSTEDRDEHPLTKTTSTKRHPTLKDMIPDDGYDDNENDSRSEQCEGGYASSSEQEDRRSGGDSDADRVELVSLRNEMALHIRELRSLQDKYYLMLHASLQENFHATSALESRVDKLMARNVQSQCQSVGTVRRPSTVLMWTIVDTICAVLLWLISALIAKPYEALRKVVVGSKDEADEILVSRKSWRLSGSKDLKSDNEMFSFAPPRRLSFREAEQWGK